MTSGREPSTGERGRGERSPSSSPFFSFGIQAGAKNDKRKISGRRGSAGARLRKSGTRLAAARAAASARLFLLLRASPCRLHFYLAVCLSRLTRQSAFRSGGAGTHTRFSQCRMVEDALLPTHYNAAKPGFWISNNSVAARRFTPAAHLPASQLPRWQSRQHKQHQLFRPPPHILHLRAAHRGPREPADSCQARRLLLRRRRGVQD